MLFFCIFAIIAIIYLIVIKKKGTIINKEKVVSVFGAVMIFTIIAVLFTGEFIVEQKLATKELSKTETIASANVSEYNSEKEAINFLLDSVPRRKHVSEINNFNNNGYLSLKKYYYTYVGTFWWTIYSPIDFSYVIE